MPEPTQEQVQALADAMWQLLDDMGESGQSVCGHAKAMARVAYEPFRLSETEELGEEVPCDYPLAAAQALIDDVNRGWRK